MFGGFEDEGVALLVVPGNGDLSRRHHFARVEGAEQRRFEVGVDEGHSVSAACGQVFDRSNFMVTCELLPEIERRGDIRHGGLRRVRRQRGWRLVKYPDESHVVLGVGEKPLRCKNE